MSRLRWPNSRHSLSDVPGTVQWHLSRSLWQIPNSRKASTKTGPPVWARLLMSALTASRRTRTSACLAAGRSRSPTSSIPASPRINTAFRATNQRSSPRRSATCPTVASPILAMMRILFRIRGHRRPVQRDRPFRTLPASQCNRSARRSCRHVTYEAPGGASTGRRFLVTGLRNDSTLLGVLMSAVGAAECWSTHTRFRPSFFAR